MTMPNDTPSGLSDGERTGPETRPTFMTKDWCLAAAEREGDQEVSAGGMGDPAWQLTRAKSALECYGRHHSWCLSWGDPLVACTCGFAQAIRDASPARAPEEAAVPTTPEPDCVHCGQPKRYHLRNFAGAWCIYPEGRVFTPAAPAVAVPGEPKSLSEHELDKTEKSGLRPFSTARTEAPQDATSALDTRTEREHCIHAIAGRALAGDHDRRSLLDALYAIVAEVGDQPFPRRR